MIAHMCLALILFAMQAPEPSTRVAPRFMSVDVLIDPRGDNLAAYQIEFVADPQRVTLVGIEGGEHPAFKTPPYYDPKALSGNRVILAALDTGTDLPQSKTRVATLHLRVVGNGEPQYSAKLETAGNAAGKPITVEVSLSEGASR